MLGKTCLAAMATIGALAISSSAFAANVAIDPGLEIVGAGGSLIVDPAPGPLAPGWVGATNGVGNVVATTDLVVSGGSYAAVLDAQAAASNPLLKNANVGIGVVQPNSAVSISFDARGEGVNGGVAFAEFFSELAGGGVSDTEILGGAPLALDPDPNVWSTFNFVTTTGSDVSGGVTLQFVAASSANFGSTSFLSIDNISIEVEMSAVPLPAGAVLLASGLGLLGWSRRRRKAT